MAKEEIFNKLGQTIIDGDIDAAATVAQEALDAGIDPTEAMLKGAAKGLDVLGERFQRLEAFLPELVKGGDAMKSCTAVLLPHIGQGEKGGVVLGKVVIGTVSGDIHDIGKTIVASLLSATGFEVIDLGVDVSAKKFVETAEEVGAKVIAMSALLTMTAYGQEEVVKRLKDMGLREKYYVIVGGSPISPEWAARIGADGYGRTAVDATQLFKRLIAEGVTPPLQQPLVIQ
jgi:corrinoid protein of di/trimethylamine methyltransferase